MATHPDDVHRGERDATKIQVAFDPAANLLAQADAVITHAGLPT
jgi:UDP:flavonoid glycosyltransferase YjiC (YdhE family)